MLIVDAQVHLWADNLPANPRHRQIPNFLTDDLLKEMDESGIYGAIIHPPGWDPNSAHWPRTQPRNIQIGFQSLERSHLRNRKVTH